MKQLMFIFFVFILFYIGPPLWERVDAIILRAELREALDYFIEEHCNEEMEITYLETPPYTTNYIMVISEVWNAGTEKSEFFIGSIFPTSKTVTMDTNACNNKSMYLLNRKINRFEFHGYSFPLSNPKLLRFSGAYFLITLSVGLAGAFLIGKYESFRKREK